MGDKTLKGLCIGIALAVSGWAFAQSGSLREPKADSEIRAVIAEKFSAEQMASLERSGVTFWVQDYVVIERLLSRGFTAEQIIKAFEDYQRIGGGQANRNKEVEHIAVMNFLGILTSENYEEYNKSKLSLTDYYNLNHIGGQSLTLWGSSLTMGGTLVTLIGIFTATSGNPCKSCYDCEDACTSDWRMSWVIPTIIGGIVLAAGLPVMGVGLSRQKKWAPSGYLENAVINDLKKYSKDDGENYEPVLEEPSEASNYGRESSAEKGNIGFVLLPAVSKEFQGMGLSLTF